MKILISTMTAGMLLIFATACNKTNTTVTSDPVTESVDVSINANETFQYTLPSTNTSSGFNVETASAKSATNTILTDANGSSFIYIPPANTTGTDVVVISTNPGQNAGGGCGHPHPHHPDSINGGNHGGACGKHSRHGKKHHHAGGCNSSGESKHTITFNITINQNTN